MFQSKFFKNAFVPSILKIHNTFISSFFGKWLFPNLIGEHPNINTLNSKKFVKFSRIFNLLGIIIFLKSIGILFEELQLQITILKITTPFIQIIDSIGDQNREILRF